MIIDTNILISLTGLDFIDLTAKENEIILKFSKLKLHEKIVPTFILTEYSTLVEKVIPKKYSLDKEGSEAVHNISRGIMKSIFEHSTIYFGNTEDVFLAGEIYEDQQDKKKPISYADSFLIAIALNNKHEILSNDSLLLSVFDKRKS